jgi:SAM-dependent methyltransferase
MSDAPADTDLTLLAQGAYAGREKLDDRRAIYAFSTAPRDFWGWMLGQIDWPARGRVLDLGCGPGSQLARLGAERPDLDLVGADVSAGMLATARAAEPRIAPVVVDAVRPPFATDAFVAVMANHMLYHVSDLHATLAEVHRVLQPGGSFLAVTNALDHFAEFDALVSEARGRPRDRARVSQRFTTDRNGPDLEAHFDEVVLHEDVGELFVTDVEPIVRYAASARDLTASTVSDERWALFLGRLADLARQRVEQDGGVRITTHVGAFVCR